MTRFTGARVLDQRRVNELSVPLDEGVFASADLLAGDSVVSGRKRCALLSLFTGVQQSAIWQWGFVERLVNGLRYIEVGPEENAVEFLAVVEELGSCGLAIGWFFHSRARVRARRKSGERRDASRKA